MRTSLFVAILLCTGIGASAQPTVDQSKTGQGWLDPGWRRTVARWSVSFEESGLNRQTFDFAYRALDNKGAVAIAQQAFSYDSAFEALTVTDLETVKADGRVIPVDIRAIKDQPVSTDIGSPYFDEQRAKIVAFSDVAAGDTIRGHLAYEAHTPFLPGAYTQAWAQPLETPPETMEVIVDGPASMPLQVATRGVTDATEQRGDRIVHHVVFQHDAPIPRRDATDSFDTARRFEVSTFRDYAALAATLAARNAPMAVPNEALKRLSAEITGDTATVRGKVERIESWVARNIRYVGIGLDDGGLTSQPAPAVLAARYADCKGHVTILKALLAAQGIVADLVAVDTAPRYTLPNVATLAFDHVIAYVPALGLYLDPTAAMVVFGSLPSTLYGKPVLNIDRGTLATIPVLTSDGFVVTTDTHYTIQPDGTREAVSTLSGTGLGASLSRTYAAALENADPAQVAARALANAELPGTGTYTFADPRARSDGFAIQAPFTITKRLDLTKPAALRLLAWTDRRPRAWALATGGVTDEAFQCSSVEVRDAASLDLPTGSTLFEAPSDLAIDETLEGDTAYGHVTGHVTIAGRVRLMGRTVRMENRATLAFDAPVCPAAFSDAIKAAVVKREAFANAGIGLTPQAIAFLIDSGPDALAARVAFAAGDYAGALARWSALAARESADAQNNIGWMYKKGLGVAQDFAESFRWYLRSAAQGNALGQSHVAYYYHCGCGVIGSEYQAALWYGRSARQGFAYAQTQLADMMMEGRGTDQNPSAAVTFYEAAAAQGDLDAERALGRIYQGGYGIVADQTRAARWLLPAAERNDTAAQEALGRLYAEGHGVPHDDDAAARWFKKAAEAGEAEAEYQLGWLYELGRGVPKDLLKAKEWYRKAVQQGHVGAMARDTALDQITMSRDKPAVAP